MNRWYARRRWIYFGLVILLGVDGVVYFAWMRRPAVLSQADQAQVARLSQEVAEQAAEVARLGRVREQAPRLRPQLEQFAAEHFLTEQTGFSRVAAELEDAASQAEVRLGELSYETQVEKAQPDILRVEISTSMEGAYPNVLHYLEELERSPHFYLINELRVAGAEGGEVRLEMRLATYLRRSET